MYTLTLLSTLLAAPALAETPGAWVAVSNNHTGLNGGAAKSGTACEINPDTGACITTTAHSRAGFALASNPNTGATYGVQGLGFDTQQLVAIDPETLAVTGAVGTLTDSTGRNHLVAAMGFNGNTLYGISARVEYVGGFRTQVGELVIINPANGAVTVVGELGIQVYSRGGVVSNGAFQMLNLTSRVDRLFSLYSVNLSTGVASNVGNTGIVGRSAAMAADPDGNVYAVMDGAYLGDPIAPSFASRLYAVNLSNGAVSGVGSTGMDLLSGFTWVYREPRCAVVMSRNVDVKDTATLSTVSCDGSGSRVTVCADDGATIEAGASMSADLVLGGTLTALGSYSGNLTELADTSQFPAIGTPTEPANPDPFPLAVDGSSVVTNDGKLALTGTQHLILPAGNYSAKLFTMSDSSRITVTGPVTLYVAGGVTIEDSAQANVGGDASDFRVESDGGQILVTNDAQFVGDLLAPTAWVRFRFNAYAEGRFWGRWMEQYDSSDVAIDTCLAP